MSTSSGKRSVIRFGIPSFDHLFGRVQSESEGANGAPYGFDLPPSHEGHATTVSFCLSGPNGTGKSIFSLHLASTYAFDTYSFLKPEPSAGKEPSACAPRVLYVSTDLKHQIANENWEKFRLDRPGARKHAFAPPEQLPQDADKRFVVKLSLVKPSELDGRLLKPPSTREVLFIDLASQATGDDWGFLHSLIAVLKEAEKAGPKHLVVVDAIEGFETFAGKRDSYGHITSRRARIAQLLRLAEGKCHLAMVVEQSGEDPDLPEEYVSDAVIRFRSERLERYSLRTVEICKARAQNHVRGTHHFVIRDGQGSTTGSAENADDPILSHGYVLVYPSLNFVVREIMHHRSNQESSDKPDGHGLASFGIRYLDSMLGQVAEKPEAPTNQAATDGGTVTDSPSARGITALIGDRGTEKSELGIAFLAHGLRQTCDELKKQSKSGTRELNRLLERLESPRIRLLLNHAKQGSRGDSSGDIAMPIEEAYQLRAGIMRAVPHFQNLFHVSLLITSQHLDSEALIEKCRPWLNLDKHDFGKLKPLIQTLTICRRIETHHLISTQLFHIIRRNIARAQFLLAPNDESHKDVLKRRKYSRRIRLVIDDLRNFRTAFPDLASDPTFLPALKFFLEHEGIASLIIDTHPAHLPGVNLDCFESRFRALVNSHIYTWPVPFRGARRIALSALPSPAGKPTPVRELRRVSDTGKPPLAVDPHFELYEGLERGEPKMVPLEVRLYAETPAFQAYIDEQNSLFTDIFVPRARPDEVRSERVITGVPAKQYAQLHDLCHLYTATHLDHTLLFQVDEFWANSTDNDLADQSDYLDAEVYSPSNGADDLSDPYRLFQPTSYSASDSNSKRNQPLKRRAFFPGIETLVPEKTDRVPFSWDFGFLLCKSRAWEQKNVKIDSVNDAFRLLQRDGGNKGAKSPSVGEIWENLCDAQPAVYTLVQAGKDWCLPLNSWRAFFGACRQVASREAERTGTRVLPFDLSLNAPESMSCLVLEVWLSEIVLGAADGMKADAEPVALEHLCNFVSQRATPENFGSFCPSLLYLVEKHKPALERTLALLAGALDLTSLFDEQAPFDFACRGALTEAVATRHWYKSAVEFQNRVSPNEPTTPARLPGRFSVRGDWFLAAMKNSRSQTLSARAMDILNSRRANIVRMQAGIGLPVRDVLSGSDSSDGEQLDFRTRLITEIDRKKQMPLRDLMKLGQLGHGQGRLLWLWRSRLKDYDRQDRIWLKWLARVFVELHLFTLQGKDSYLKNFAIYDFLLLRDVLHPTLKAQLEKTNSKGKSLPITRQRAQIRIKEVHEAYNSKKDFDFDKLVDFLKFELKQSSPAQDRWTCS